MIHRYKAITLVTLISAILFIPLVSGSTLSTTTSAGGYKIQYWEQWDDSDSQDVSIITESQLRDLGISATEGYTPGSIFHCWTPYKVVDNSLQKVYWRSNVKPVKCVWEYYDPHMHRFCKVEKKPVILSEGNFDGYKYLFADTNEFVIPALFISDRYGEWTVRTYFIFEDGSVGGEGPVTDDEGNSYLIIFPVTKGSWFDLVFTAPIYILGHKTIPLFWWLSPIWIFLIFFVILVIYTHSVVGAVKAIKGAVRATKEAKTEWRKK